MTTDQKAKYEKTAESQRDYPGVKENQTWYKFGFVDGASFAEKENNDFIQKLRKIIEEKDEQMALQHEIHKKAEKEAHNAAIDKALTAMKIEWREDRHEIYNAIAKLKI